MNRRQITFRLPLLICLIAGLPVFSSAAQTSLVYHQAALWSASSAGEIKKIPFEAAGGENIDQVGTTDPVPSPDGRYVAYTRENDLWIRDLRSGESYQASRLGRAGDETFAGVYVLVTAWSPDSTAVLHYLSHADPTDPEGLAEEKEIRPAPYGYRIYDFSQRTARPAPLSGEFKLWLADGRFILSSQEKEFLQQYLLVQKPDSELPERLLNVRGQWAHLDASRDGKWLIASLAQPFESKPGQMEDETELSSRIVKISLRNGKIQDVTARGSWSEYQMPRFSPNGKRISWIRQGEQDRDGFTRASLVVDGREAASFPGSITYAWIDDATFVVSHSEGIDVVTVDGRRLGQAVTDPAAGEASLPPR